MGIFKSEKISTRLFLFVTALDETVIARPNFELTEDGWEDLPPFTSQIASRLVKLGETPVYDHLCQLIQEPKYSFLKKNVEEYYELMNVLGNAELPSIYWQEINSLKRFGYYYGHTLAITAMIAKFGIDAGMQKDLLEIALKASLIHDIGIARLPHSILFSSQQFKEDEKIMMQQHPLVSFLLVGYYSQREYDEIGRGVLYHHCPGELNNISIGYENKVAKEIAWLIFNADVFDALISNRPFRPAYAIANALNYLNRVNQAHSLPLDMVCWIEKRFKIPVSKRLGSNFIPIKPKIEGHQLN
jgi:hypothetical protein